MTTASEIRTRRLNWAVDADDVMEILDPIYMVQYCRRDWRRILTTRGAHSYVTFMKNELVGVYSYRENKREKLLEIIEFCVAELWQGRGIGHWQMRRIKDRLGEVFFTLRHDVHERDDEAIAFLAREGFVATLIRGAATDGEDCYRMEFNS